MKAQIKPRYTITERLAMLIARWIMKPLTSAARKKATADMVREEVFFEACRDAARKEGGLFVGALTEDEIEQIEKGEWVQ